ncbi:hypothetical protein EDE12_101560 [Methylosinus sp. sav-2]|uniref:hypothetical protein n=1 Tax=Methylosinus sp. sav-2 TaxID=2485168 RepID=UPI000690E18C|nr:hypothetical protein [Methylosinus sp. sav-2]TDX67021.1 hypothetical protein EDE12_101560 [Methylosinus sp. sav-2]
MILRLRTGSETLILGPRSAFAGLAGRDRRALVSEYEVRRRLRLALADPEGADALRRAFALWREEGARIREADDHALIDRVARMSRNGALAAFVVQDRAKGLGVSTAAAPPGGANLVGANVTGMNLQERLAATLRLVPNHLSGTTKQAFAELIEPKALATTVEVLALWAISHAFGAGEAIDAVLLAAGLYFGGAQVWGGLHALFHALDLIRMAQSVTQLDEAAAIFAEGVTKLGIAVLIAALTHGAAKKAGRWTEKKPSLRNTPQERAPKAERYEPKPSKPAGPPNEQKLLQPGLTEQLAKIYEKAPAAKQEIDAIAAEIAEKTGGAVAKAPLKDIDRARAKIIADYQGDASRIRDIARNTIVVEKENFDAAVALLKEKGAKCKIIDAGSDALGYSGANTVLKTEAGIMAEIQVNTPQMIFAKETPEVAKLILGEEKYAEIAEAANLEGGRGHALYEAYRDLPAGDPRAAEIEAESRAYYDAIRRAGGK